MGKRGESHRLYRYICSRQWKLEIGDGRWNILSPEARHRISILSFERLFRSRVWRFWWQGCFAQTDIFFLGDDILRLLVGWGKGIRRYF